MIKSVLFRCYRPEEGSLHILTSACVLSGGGRAVPAGGDLGVPLGPQRQQRPLQPGVCPLGQTEGLEPLELPLAVQ